MADQHYKPIQHSALGRAGHVVGEGAKTGFRWGLFGLAVGGAIALGIGTLAAWGTHTAITGGFAAASSGFSFSAIMTGIGTALTSVGAAIVAAGPVLIAAGVGLAVTAVVVGPSLLAGTGLGAALGITKGGHDGAVRTAGENLAFRERAGYEAQMAGMQSELVAALQQQAMAEQAMLAQARQRQITVPKPVTEPKAIEHGHTPAAHGHEHGHKGKRPGDAYAAASVHHETPDMKMDAATAAHEGLTRSPQIEAAKA